MQDIHRIVDELKCKLTTIKQVCPKAKVFVSPVLPSRLPRMNANIVTFNRIVDSMLLMCFPDVWFEGVSSFLDSDGLLSSKMTRGSDKIHLGPRGIAKFVSHVKRCIFQREVKSRSMNVRSYLSDSASIGPSTQESANPAIMGPIRDP